MTKAQAIEKIQELGNDLRTLITERFQDKDWGRLGEILLALCYGTHEDPLYVLNLDSDRETLDFPPEIREAVAKAARWSGCPASSKTEVCHNLSGVHGGIGVLGTATALVCASHELEEKNGNPGTTESYFHNLYTLFLMSEKNEPQRYLLQAQEALSELPGLLFGLAITAFLTRGETKLLKRALYYQGTERPIRVVDLEGKPLMEGEAGELARDQEQWLNGVLWEIREAFAKIMA